MAKKMKQGMVLGALGVAALVSATFVDVKPAAAAGCGGYVNIAVWGCAPWDNNPRRNAAQQNAYKQEQNQRAQQERARQQEAARQANINAGRNGGNLVAAGGGNIVAAGGGNMRGR